MKTERKDLPRHSAVTRPYGCVQDEFAVLTLVAESYLNAF
jgi:hypothetical protein